MPMMWRVLLTCVLVVASVVGVGAFAYAQTGDKHLMTVYDRGETRVFFSDAETIRDALGAQGITLDARDTVEPGLDEELVAPEYKVNIYRARPVIIVDGPVRVKTVSPFQTAQQIARDVGITVYDEDFASVKPLSNFVTDGAGLEMTVIRATTIVLDLFGKKTEVRTQAKTVGDLLDEKAITLGENGRVSLPEETVIVAGMELRIWREGKQTVTVDEAIAPSSQIVYDADRPYGYRAVQAEGRPGNRSITYELEVRDGVEISRVEIANIVTQAAGNRTEVIGIRNDGTGLTKSKGAQQFTDSKGVTHRETYYDLNMRVVMQSCGQGGRYSVRPDGAKVDAQGYVIIAANYANYPKCSIVETSLGPGKVYDTGGFAQSHPYGFDLATDWTAADGI
jgi:resuscitation-promoting factor RpfB